MHSSEPWRVGVLFSQTGPTAIIEQTQARGTLLAIHEINAAGGVNGRPIEPVAYDPASSPKRFDRLAERLLARDGVSTIFGCYMSSTRKAVLPAVGRHNGLLFYPTLYEGFEHSPNVIYTGASPNQNSVQLADYLVRTYGGRFYLVGSNYVFPYESNRIMRDLLAEHDGEVVGEHYAELDETDFRLVIEDIKRKRPDVIFSTVVGRATVHFYRAYAEAGLNPEIMPIASLTTCEAEVQAMGVDAARGHITAAPYFHSVPSDKNEAFIARVKKMYGEDAVTNMCLEAAYFQMHLFANALRETGSLDTDALRTALAGSAFEAPQGPIRIDPVVGHAHLWPRIGRVGQDGQFTILKEASRPVVPDPYLGSHMIEEVNADPLRSEPRVVHGIAGLPSVTLPRDPGSYNVLLVHPRDQDGEEMRKALERVGCRVRTCWPPPTELPSDIDIVFFGLCHSPVDAIPWDPSNPPAALVAIIDLDKTTDFRRLMAYNPHAVISKPIRPIERLTSLVLARNLFERQSELEKRVNKLQKKLGSLRRIERAKEILIKKNNITEKEAYEIIRTQAMKRRVTTEEIASKIIDADEVLSTITET